MTDPLIEQLVAGLGPTRPLRNRNLWLHCTACLTMAALLILAIMGIRPDWQEAIKGGALLWKPAIFLLLLVSSILLVTDISRPDGKAKSAHLLPLLLALAILIWRFFSADINLASLYSPTAYYCLSIIIFGGAMVMLAVWFFWFKKTASLQPTLLGALSGLSAGSLVAAAYALHCNQDAGIYVSVYYILPIMLLSLAGGALGRSKLKW